MYEIVAFITFSALTLGMFGITVFSKNALYSMSSLAGGMIFISGFFFLLDAEFLGIVQIIVYSGAIMALYAFGMMFFDSSKDVKENIASKRLIYTLATLSALLLVFIVCAPIFSSNIEASNPIVQGIGNIQLLGVVIFTKYLVPFELAAIMLLVAMICGIVLVHKNMDKSETLNDNGFEIKEQIL